MKKIFLTIATALTLSAGLTSCGDNSDFWGLHSLTDEELAEMARQDSIAEANRQRINADLVLTYDVEFYISANSYDGGAVQVDMDQIATLFGVDKATLCENLDNGTGDVTPFAIEGTTHADNMGAGTSGTYWGHWWNADGNVCNWGEEAMVFTEFNGESETMNVGQYPGHLADGQTIKVIEALKYKDKRVAVVFNIKAVARGEVTATVVGTTNVQIAMSPQFDYSANPIAIPADEICKNLGISSMADAQFLCLNSDGSYCQETDDGWGFWIGKDGFKGSWGVETAAVMVGWDNGASEIAVLQMPEAMAAGESCVAHCAFLANNKVQLLDVAVSIKAYEDPETAPEGTPYTVEKDITLESTYNTDWDGAVVDVKEILRDAFKMTTYQIFSAIKSGDVKGYIDEVTEADPKYTADPPGYWLDGDGKAIEYADGLAYLMLEGTETELVLSMANHPDNCPPAGKTINTKYILTCNGGKVVFNVTLKINAAAAKKHRK